jgi:uncharacterized protein YqkB
MIVGCPAPAGAAERKTIAFFESAVVISAITFYQAEGDQCGSSLIPWLGVASIRKPEPVVYTEFFGYFPQNYLQIEYIWYSPRQILFIYFII